MDVHKARKAAEALFAPKRPIADLPTPNGSGSVALGNRKPRILTRRPSKRVPASQLTRLRTWLKYGMTTHQAADVYGVSDGEIECMLQNRNHD